MADQCIVRIYAQFPVDINALESSSLDDGWEWAHCLSFPVQVLNHPGFRISRYPYKWIRFATGVVLGVKGHLSTSKDIHGIVPYNEENISTGTVDLYFIALQSDMPNMLPVDPNVRQEWITSREESGRQTDFRSSVMQRDANVCVLNGAPPVLCAAVHVLARSKGDAVSSSFACFAGSLFPYTVLSTSGL